MKPLVTRLCEANAAYDRAISRFLPGNRRAAKPENARKLYTDLWRRFESISAVSEALQGEGVVAGTADAVGVHLRDFARAQDVEARYAAHKALTAYLSDARTQARPETRGFQDVFQAKGAPAPAQSELNWTQRKDIG